MEIFRKNEEVWPGGKTLEKEAGFEVSKAKSIHSTYGLLKARYP